MSSELRIRTSQSQQAFVRAYSSAWRSGIQLYEPSTWLLRHPDIEEQMLRDADIGQALTYRKHLIAGRDWTLTPRDEASPMAELAVNVGTRLLEPLNHFTAARLLLARAFFSGSRFARIHTEARTLTIGDGKPRTWLVPTRLEDLDKRMYRPVPNLERTKRDKNGDLIDADAFWERWHVLEQEWVMETLKDSMRTIRHVYQDDQASLGHGRGLREALGWWWYTKTHVMEETIQAIEKYAQGTLHMQVDGLRDADGNLPNATVMQEYVDTLEDMRSHHILVTDLADELKVITGNADGWQLLDKMEEKLKNTITTLILGSNLPTTASEGGSYALAQVQENSTEALIQFDRETLQETLTKNLLGCIWWQNYPNLLELGIAEEKPRFSITQEKRQDPKERAEVAAVLHNMGVALSSEELYEQTGFRKPEQGEEILEGATAPAPGLGGFGAPDPFGAGVR